MSDEEKGRSGSAASHGNLQSPSQPAPPADSAETLPLHTLPFALFADLQRVNHVLASENSQLKQERQRLLTHASALEGQQVLDAARHERELKERVELAAKEKEAFILRMETKVQGLHEQIGRLRADNERLEKEIEQRSPRQPCFAAGSR